MSSQAELTLVASLPPSPEEIAEAERIRDAVQTIRRTTEAVVALVADNAYGFADAAAERLYAALVDTNALCRQTEHGMLRCRPRAAAVALGGDPATGDALEQLSAEVAEAVAQFRLVATAARSASAQAKAAADAAGTAPPSAPPPPHDSWERLFELRGGGGARSGGAALPLSLWGQRAVDERRRLSETARAPTDDELTTHTSELDGTGGSGGGGSGSGGGGGGGGGAFADAERELIARAGATAAAAAGGRVARRRHRARPRGDGARAGAARAQRLGLWPGAAAELGALVDEGGRVARRARQQLRELERHGGGGGDGGGSARRREAAVEAIAALAAVVEVAHHTRVQVAAASAAERSPPPTTTSPPPAAGGGGGGEARRRRRRRRRWPGRG